MTQELDELLRRAKNHVMTEEELAAQRASFVRAMMPAGHDMTTAAIQARIVELDAKLAAATCWGAALTEINEERQELAAELRKRGY